MSKYKEGTIFDEVSNDRTLFKHTVLKVAPNLSGDKQYYFLESHACLNGKHYYMVVSEEEITNDLNEGHIKEAYVCK